MELFQCLTDSSHYFIFIFFFTMVSLWIYFLSFSKGTLTQKTQHAPTYRLWLWCMIYWGKATHGTNMSGLSPDSQCDAAIISVVLWGREGDGEQCKCDGLHYTYAIHRSDPSIKNTGCTLTECVHRDVNGGNCFSPPFARADGKKKEGQARSCLTTVAYWSCHVPVHHIQSDFQHLKV